MQILFIKQIDPLLPFRQHYVPYEHSTGDLELGSFSTSQLVKRYLHLILNNICNIQLSRYFQ